MRLINSTTLKIHEFLSEDAIEPYAILSHTWGGEECTLQQMEHPDDSMVTAREGYRKIHLCCKQARKDGLRWAWVDTYVHYESRIINKPDMQIQLLH